MRHDDHIMYIDDEDPNLVAFRAIFRREFSIITASNADEARTKLDENPHVKVIISDHRMQGASGIEFFESILKDHPEPVRIILTGFADQKSMLDSINRARVYRFLSKPWNEHDLRQTILSGIELYDTRRDLHQKQKRVELELNHLSKFVHTASNEMRSTLVSMHGMVKMALSNPKQVDIKEFLPLIDRGIIEIDLQLRNIIDHYNNQKHLSKLEDINLEKLIQEATESMESLIDLSKVELRVTNPFKPSLYSDSFKLQLVFNNLISHTINNLHPNQEEVLIDIEIGQNPDGVDIVYTDNTKVVETDLSGTFFDAMISGEGKNNMTLYLVKEAVKQIKGSIEVDSVPGAGTSYVIFVPNLKPESNGDIAA